MVTPRTSLTRWIAVVAVLLLAAPTPFLPIENADAQTPGCEAVNHPLFIERMVFKPRFGVHEDSVIEPDNRTAFVHGGDSIEINITLVNRVPDTPDCTTQYSQSTSDDLSAEVYYLPNADDTPADNRDQDVNWYEDDLQGENCNSLTEGQECDVTLRFPRTGDSGRTVLGQPAGEQRVIVRFLDDDAEEGQASAERILVVEQLPDLNPSNVDWVQPGQQENRYTIYSGPGDNSKFEIRVDNQGTYPNWNPNGGNQYSMRSSFDSNDGDNQPDDDSDANPYDNPENPDTLGPPCSWDTNGDGTPDDENDQLDEDEAPCSYRRGQILDMPVHWEAFRHDTDELVDSGLDTSQVYSDLESDLHDKDDAIIDGQSDDVTVFALDRYEKAGLYDLRLHVDHRPDRTPHQFTPEQSETNNEIEETNLEILGSDLKIFAHGIEIQTTDGSIPPSECLDPEDPCPADATLDINPRYFNDGDLNVPENVTDRLWRASLNVTVGLGEAASEIGNATAEFDQIPTDSRDRRLFEEAQTFDVNESGGVHQVIIRLDHPIAYEGDGVTDEEGRVAERVENHTIETCSAEVNDDTDNVYCLNLHFLDISEPTVENLEVDTDATDDEDEREDGDTTVPEVWEGRNATFYADVTDNALVPPPEAVFELPDGNTTTLDMSEVDGEEDTYSVTTNFTGMLGDYVYKVKAEDSVHTTISDPGMEVRVVELPKEIEQAPGRDVVNGETAPQGDTAPVYEGSYSSPENWFNVTWEVNNTGHDNASEGKAVQVYAPNGSLEHEIDDVEDLIVCERTRLGEQMPNGVGGECDPDDPLVNVTREWKRWYVNTDEDRWEHFEMRWAGEFNITIKQTDTFGRSNHSAWGVEIADRENDNGAVEPIVTEVDTGPMELDPGEKFSASAHAADVLRVDRVYLDVEKPGGDSAEANLTVNQGQLDDAETRNGTYNNKFTAGIDGDVFDRGGSYEVSLVAEDFAGNKNVTDVGTVSVVDTDDPTIDAFFTEPGTVQEVGGNITWVARVSDSTAIQPPTLTITKPTSETIETEMTFDEDRDAWVHEITTNPSEEGPWSYELEVADYAGHVTTDAGQIDVDSNLAPRASDWAPATRGEGPLPYGNATPTISVRVLDTQGVDPDSINMTVNGESVYGAGGGDATLAPIPNTCPGCYELTYKPPEPFEGGETVTVEVRAQDLSEAEKLSEFHVHQFEVDTSAPSASVDLTPSLSSQDTPVIGATTDINVSMSDAGAGPGPLRVVVEHLAGASATHRQSRVFDDGSGSFRLSSMEKAFQGHGLYRIILQPRDAVDNAGDTIQKRVLFDKAPPKIILVPELNKPRSFVSANVTDLSRVQDVVVSFTANNGPEQELPLRLEGDKWKGRIVDPETGTPYPENTTIEFVVEASDFFGNVATTNATTFTAGNAVPTIAIDAPSSGATIDGRTTVSWTASDAETNAPELKISLWYKKPGGEPREIPGASDLDNTGQYELDTTVLPNGEIQLQAIVFDGSTFGADSVNVTVRNLGETFKSPEIRGAEVIDGSPVVEPGQDTTFSVQIDGNVRAAWANVTRDGELVESYTLEDAGGGTWETSMSIPEEPGDYSVDLAALTAEGPARTGDAYGFTVQSGEDGKSFVPEWTILSVLFAGAVAVGAFGLSRRWT